MFKSGYYITAELRATDPARASLAKSELQKLCEATRTEPGCSIFQLHYDPAEPTRFMLWERFDDEASYKAHFEMAHTKAYGALKLTEVVQVFRTDIA